MIGTQQKVEQHSQDDGQEKRAGKVERVESGQHEESGIGERPDFYPISQCFSQLLDIRLVDGFAPAGSVGTPATSGLNAEESPSAGTLVGISGSFGEWSPLSLPPGRH